MNLKPIESRCKPLSDEIREILYNDPEWKFEVRSAFIRDAVEILDSLKLLVPRMGQGDLADEMERAAKRIREWRY